MIDFTSISPNGSSYTRHRAPPVGPGSPSWAWATKDFANLDLQRAVWVLAYLYATDFPGNRFFKQSALIDWIGFGIRFWIKSQDGYGAFDHLYPYESSWMAAAFTLVDMLETRRLVGTEFSSAFNDDWLAACERCGQFLLHRNETHGFISNHRAAAAAGLLSLAEILVRQDFERRAWALMDEVYSRQSREGWFLEYEGPDPGYQTLHTHYQALFYLTANRHPEVLDRVGRSLIFLSYFVHPDGSVGGEYGSRACPHFFPGGVEVFARELPIVEAIARHATRGLAEGHSSGLMDADPRNVVPLASSYALAHRTLAELLPETSAQMPFERHFERFWPEAGLYVRSEKQTYTIFGASKGGVVKVFDNHRQTLLHSSCGYAGRLNGRHVSSHLYNDFYRLDASNLSDGDEADLEPFRTLALTTPFLAFSPNRLMSPLKLVLFRLFNLTVGRVKALNDLVRKHFIIKRYLKRKTKCPAVLNRTLQFAPDRLTVLDHISCKGTAKWQMLREYGAFSTVYMASARYFRTQDFNQAWLSEDLVGRIIEGNLYDEREIRYQEEGKGSDGE
jgi:hypothetical protein